MSAAIFKVMLKIFNPAPYLPALTLAAAALSACAGGFEVQNIYPQEIPGTSQYDPRPDPNAVQEGLLDNRRVKLSIGSILEVEEDTPATTTEEMRAAIAEEETKKPQ